MKYSAFFGGQEERQLHGECWWVDGDGVAWSEARIWPTTPSGSSSCLKRANNCKFLPESCAPKGPQGGCSESERESGFLSGSLVLGLLSSAG